MPKGPIRRSQLIAPFGVGALVVTRDGTSVVSGGLDHWYRREMSGATSGPVDASEFMLEEWQLQAQLDVSHFRLPPDYRLRGGRDVPNLRLTVPFLRFPQWHFCRKCSLLMERPLVERARPKCPECESKGLMRFMLQVPFVAICDRGHLQDFPWREWVHSDHDPKCTRPLRLVATGGATLAAQMAKCDCGKSRSLAGIMGATSDGSETDLSNTLEKGSVPYLCRGHRPWLGTEDPEHCDRPLKGSLRSASNLYYADVRSAIYVPREGQTARLELVELLSAPPLSTVIQMLGQMGEEIDPARLRQARFNRELLEPYTDSDVALALKELRVRSKPTSPAAPKSESRNQRREEYKVLREGRDEPQLLVQSAPLADYEDWIGQYFSREQLVKKLRETRVFAGFSRIFPQNDLSLTEKRRMLRARQLRRDNDWLPAYTVFGEGVFLEFNEEALQQWESRPDVRSRIEGLATRYASVQQARRLQQREVVPRFVLIHTLGHLLMNQLTFDCGYSTAALRERLYVSEDSKSPMAGLLIYTASGDSEGTMGGLVGMASPGRLEHTLLRALESASWCSADPVCLEAATRGGQGPDSCNLAACHCCGLVPETACEEFNRFLDRGVVVSGMLGELGFFDVSTARADGPG